MVSNRRPEKKQRGFHAEGFRLGIPSCGSRKASPWHQQGALLNRMAQAQLQQDFQPPYGAGSWPVFSAAEDSLSGEGL